MTEGEQPRQIIEKNVTPRQLQFVEQLSRACEIADQVDENVQKSKDGNVTMWTRTQPDVAPVYLRANEQAHRGIVNVIFSRYIDLDEEGLGDVALSVMRGGRYQPVQGIYGADVIHPRPDRTPEGHRAELRKLEEDAREIGEDEMTSHDDDLGDDDTAR